MGAAGAGAGALAGSQVGSGGSQGGSQASAAAAGTVGKREGKKQASLKAFFQRPASQQQQDAQQAQQQVQQQMQQEEQFLPLPEPQQQAGQRGQQGAVDAVAAAAAAAADADAAMAADALAAAEAAREAKQQQSRAAWAGLLAKNKPPQCRHNEPAALLRVNKQGPNKGGCDAAAGGDAAGGGKRHEVQHAGSVCAQRQPGECTSGAACRRHLSRPSCMSAAWQGVQRPSFPPRLHSWLPSPSNAPLASGRWFYTCARAAGPPPEGKCNFFKWVERKPGDPAHLTLAGNGGGGGKKSGDGGSSGSAPASKRLKA